MMQPKSFVWAAGVAIALSTPQPCPAQDGVPKPDELFKQLDKNNDGKLTKDEVPEEQRRFFDRSVRVGDKDDDGALTKDEFLQATKPPETGNIPLTPGGGPGGDRRGDMRQRFEMMDRNKDGKLALDEVPEPFRDRMKAVFDRLGKTELSMEEYGRALGGIGGGQGQFDPATLFTRFDKNNDGKLTKDEVPDEFQERMAQAFERLGTKEITREQFLEMSRRTMAPGGNPPGSPPRDGAEGRRFLPAFVRLLDVDNDGRLSKVELAKAADKFAELDENNDGQLEMRELMGPPPAAFAGGPGGNPEMRRPDGNPRPGGGNPTGPFFAQMDRNGDGKISKDEAPERMKEVFGRLDTDNDGFLTADEMRAAAERFQNRPGASRPEGAPERPRRPPTEDKPEAK